MKPRKLMFGLTTLIILALLISVGDVASTPSEADVENETDYVSDDFLNTLNNGGNGTQPENNSTITGNRTQTGINIDKNKKTVDIESAALMVMINAGGEVPIYQFWSIKDNDTKFHVKFQKIQEFTDTNDNGIYENNETVGQRTLSLQSVNWILSDAVVDEEQISFIFTSESFQQSQFSGFQIKLVNHINLVNATSLKFDIYMSGWPFMNTDNKLSLRWDLSWTNDNIDYETASDGTYLKYDGDILAHFTYVSEVMIGDSSETVSASYFYNEASDVLQTFFDYPNFQDLELVHDPEIGVSSHIIDDVSSDIVPILKDAVPHISKDGFIISTVLATLVLTGLYMYRKKR
ncbi:MAG: hypothetical protein ACFFCQ_13660 [Promethearchaeota archaeon]